MKDINIGFAAHENISDLKKIDAASSKQIAEYINDVITFIVSLLGKIFERSPIKSIVVVCASIFDPCILATEEYGDKLNKTAIAVMIDARRKPSCVFNELEILLSKECLVCTLPFFKVY